ncbi:MAG: protein kinase [Sandaracinaceae bacterium]
MASGAREAGARGSAGTEHGTADVLPRRFGRYTLFDRIGRGGMADIYLAQVKTEIGAPRRVVVKEILPGLGQNPRFAKMLVDEAKLVAGLSHANIAGVTDLGREGDRLFIAMEYVEGFDLNQLLRQLSKRRIPLPADFALFVVREVLAGLDFAHRKRDDAGEPLGIVHRDVSPSNVLISFEGEVKLCDFGIARAFGSDVAEGGSGAVAGGEADDTGERSKVAGKAAYMSPEHANGNEVDARSDLFSAGIVLWELSAGRRLYKGSEAKMLELARAAQIPPLPEGRLPNQEALQGILDRALAVDPEARFQRAADMLRALDEYMMGSKLFASQLRFASFLTDHFESDVVVARRERERAIVDMEDAPPAEPVAPTPLAPAPLAPGRAALNAEDAHPGLTDDFALDDGSGGETLVTGKPLHMVEPPSLSLGRPAVTASLDDVPPPKETPSAPAEPKKQTALPAPERGESTRKLASAPSAPPKKKGRAVLAVLVVMIVLAALAMAAIVLTR